MIIYRRRKCADCGIHNTSVPHELLCPKGKGIRSPHDSCIVPGSEGMAEDYDAERQYQKDVAYLTETQKPHSITAIYDRCVRKVS